MVYPQITRTLLLLPKSSAADLFYLFLTKPLHSSAKHLVVHITCCILYMCGQRNIPGTAWALKLTANTAKNRHSDFMAGFLKNIT